MKDTEASKRDSVLSAKDSELQDLLETVNELQEAAEIGLAFVEAQKRLVSVGVGEGSVAEADAVQAAQVAQAALEAQAKELRSTVEVQAQQLKEALGAQDPRSLQHASQSGDLRRQVQKLREDLEKIRREFSAGAAAHSRDLQRLSTAVGPLCRLALRSAQLLKENIKLRNSLQDVRVRERPPPAAAHPPAPS